MPGSASDNPWATELKSKKAKRQTSNVSSDTEASFKSAAGNGNGSTGNGASLDADLLLLLGIAAFAQELFQCF